MAKKRDTRWLRDDLTFEQWAIRGFVLAAGLAILGYPLGCVAGLW